MYETGNGVGKDLVMSRQLIERSALAGNRIAMHDIALFYTEGLGDVEPNIKTAAGWFEKAAERGVINSQFNLGVLFESGQGMPKNLSNAYVWYGIAAAQGDKPAAERFEILKSELSAADVKRANARIDAFRPTRINETANGIFKQVPWAVAAEAPDTTSSPAKSQILSAQTLLGQLGYNPGSADGSMGPKTRSAIIKFQQDNGLVESGQVNTALISELQKASGA
jgi:localization factor PodJL